MFEFVAFDVETTGTRPGRDKIIEIGAERFKKGQPVESFSTFVKIDGSIPAAATRVNKITDDMLIGQPIIHDALENFTEFCKDLPLVAHNAQFDVKFIGCEGEECGVALPEKVVLDSYQLAKRALPDLFNHRLESVLKHLHIESGTLHRAHEDAKVCGIAFIELIKLLRQNEERLTAKKLIDLSGGELRFPIVKPRARQLDFL